MGEATFIKQRNSRRGEGRVYQLDPLLAYTTYNDEFEEVTDLTEYVWVSAAVTYSGPETYIFASDAEGNVTSWSELPGSFRGGLDHEAALRNAGYSVRLQIGAGS